MLDLGFVKPGETIRIPFSSFDKDDGSSITMTNFTTADILIYKDGNTTERASTNGFTATTDFDGKTGKHLAIIDLSDNTTADFFAAGSEYLVAIDSVTVDGVTVGGWIARFKIGYDAALFNTTIASLTSQTSFTLTVGPADNGALIGCVALIHDAASAVQRAIGVVSGYTGVSRTVTLAADPAIFTMAAKDNISFFAPSNTRFLGGTVQTGGDVGGNTTTILANTNAIQNSTVATTGYVNDAAASTTVFKTSLLDATGFWDDATITFTSGTLDGQTKPIASYSATNGTITLDEPLTSAPAQYDTFQINVSHVHPTSQIAAAVWEYATRTLSGTLGSFDAIWTKIKAWLGAIAGKTADTVTRAEINATTAGVGYNETTDSQEALRDRGDTAWLTASGFSTLDADGVRTAIGLATANLDTQLSLLGTATAVEVLRKLLRADHYIDTSVTPWALVYMQEGTGGIGVGTELFRKRLFNTSGSNLTSTDTVVGQAKV